MSNPGEEPKVDTEAQARNWLVSLVEELRELRAAIDVPIEAAELLGSESVPIERARNMLAAEQRARYGHFRIKYGIATGVLLALHRCRKLSDVAYNELRAEILDTMTPTVVGAR